MLPCYHAAMHCLVSCVRRVVAGLMVIVGLWGCGTGGSASQFPSREQIQKLAERPAAALPSKGELADVEEWELEGPLPSQVEDETVALSEPWRDVAAELAGKRPGLILASNSAACMARQIGLFFAAKRARMTESLERFIAARCGITGTPQIAHGFRYQEVHGAVDERRMAAEWRPLLKNEMVSSARYSRPTPVSSLAMYKGTERRSSSA